MMIMAIFAAIEFMLWVVIFAACLALFVKIQEDVNNPERKQLNDKWYAAFETYNAKRFADKEIEWRTKDFSELFAKADNVLRSLRNS